MDSENLVILPHQLFEINKLTDILPNTKNIKNLNIYIWEHPHYFKTFNYNKKKLILHRSSMKYYFDYLKKNNLQVSYIQYNDTFNLKDYLVVDPIDKIKLPGKYELLESPNFLMTKEQYSQYRQKTDKYLFNNFYMWSKDILNILPGVKSQDKMNRNKLPKNVEIPKLPSNKTDTRYIKEAISYVETNFPKNYGNVDNFVYPCTHTTAKKWLRNFISNKFDNFGPYQDAIIEGKSFLFHSILSSSINIGLINPSDIVKEVLKVKSKVNLASLEGYIRQLFWREYQRYCYIYYPFEGKNYFGNRKKLNKKWYTGELGIKPVDDCIVKGFDTAYLHHIERLMVVGNFMNLYGLSPMEGFKWFMEFSIDSYLWVMYQNVLDMVFFVSGGATMRKPYASSSNYILKMSNYSKGDWSSKWDEYYHDFMKKNKGKLWKFRYHFPGLKKM